jgi:hypothetical protein
VHLHGLELSGFQTSAIQVRWAGGETEYQDFLSQPASCPHQVVISHLDLHDNQAADNGAWRRPW